MSRCALAGNRRVPHPVTILCGPTASGKSALALELAARDNGVIINADSMQLYDALPLLSARPGADDLRAAPHRLYGCLPVHEKSSAQRWRDRALDEINTAITNGQHPILVGGTGLYIKSLCVGFSPIPDVPPDIRAKGVAMQRELGNPAFHAALAARDSVMGARLNPNDTQRLIRAWEVLEASGKSLSHWQTQPPIPPPENLHFTIRVLTPERDWLYARCDRRFDMMMAMGALDEVAAAMAVLNDDMPITHALGYRPLRDHLKGLLSLEDAITAAKAETRQYAKRQDTWFRHQVGESTQVTVIRETVSG